MDYDATDIPAAYDLGRSHGPEVLKLRMDTVSSYVLEPAVTSILDLGCGTGRFSEALAGHFNAQVIGIDPSKKMLEQARSKLGDADVRYQFGRAEAIPLPDGSVDMIFMSMIFHHLQDPRLPAREYRRVLREGGTAFLRAGTRERIPSYPYVTLNSFRPVGRCWSGPWQNAVMFARSSRTPDFAQSPSKSLRKRLHLLSNAMPRR